MVKMICNWTFNEFDESAARELDAYLPAAVFDIHAHLYRVSDLNMQHPGLWGEGPGETGIGIWLKHIGRQTGINRLLGGLFFPAPAASCSIDEANDFLISQLNKNNDSRGLILISPEYSPNKAAVYFDHAQIAGFKPYHVFSREKPTFQSTINGYLPEWVWEMADKRESVIMLHLVRDKALADYENQKIIREMCGKYPGVKLVLAHAGRGFHAANTIGGVSAYKDIRNIWFDTSGICESAAIRAVLKEFGPQRLLWGTDFPISEIRGRCVSVGDGFIWLKQDTVNWNMVSPACNPVLVGLESLRALKEAAEDLRLGKEDLQDIFCNNALRLLGINKKYIGR